MKTKLIKHQCAFLFLFIKTILNISRPCTILDQNIEIYINFFQVEVIQFIQVEICIYTIATLIIIMSHMPCHEVTVTSICMEAIPHIHHRAVEVG